MRRNFIERELHGYNVLSGFILALQVYIIFEGIALIRIFLESGRYDTFRTIILLLVALLWLLGEILINKLYLKI